jgi:hypothetical protein
MSQTATRQNKGKREINPKYYKSQIKHGKYIIILDL